MAEKNYEEENTIAGWLLNKALEEEGKTIEIMSLNIKIKPDKNYLEKKTTEKS